MIVVLTMCQRNVAAFQRRLDKLSNGLTELQFQQSASHIDLLKLFLPETFFETEYDGLQV